MYDNPIVILLGAGRSGTKFLRDTLSGGKDVGIVPYDVNYVWRHGNHDYPTDILPPDICSDKIQSYIQSNIVKMAQRQSGLSNPAAIVEKTVSNTLRVPFVRKAFPNARFVHLLRDGKSVVESSSRIWELPMDKGYMLKKLRYFPIRDFTYGLWFLKNTLGRGGEEKNAWGPRYEDMDKDLAEKPLLHVCARQWADCAETAVRDLEEVPADRQMTVRYEDLVSSENPIREICQFAGIDEAGVLDRFKKTVRTDNVDKWKSVFTNPEDITLLGAQMNSTLKKFGYEQFPE